MRKATGKIVYKLLRVGTLERLRMVAVEVQDEKPAEILVSSRCSLGVDLGGIVHRTL